MYKSFFLDTANMTEPKCIQMVIGWFYSKLLFFTWIGSPRWPTLQILYKKEPIGK
jgi:hypothetical protein